MVDERRRRDQNCAGLLNDFHTAWANRRHRKRPPTGATLLFRESSFDIGVHCLGEGALNSNHRVPLNQNVLLDEQETAFAGIGWSDIQILVDGSLGQRDTVWVPLGDQSTQDVRASCQMRHRANMRPVSKLGHLEIQLGTPVRAIHTPVLSQGFYLPLLS